MTCDLERLYGTVAEQLPSDEEADGFLITREVLPVPSDNLVTDRLVIKRQDVDVNGHLRVDRLTFLLAAPTMRQLGVLTLAVLFHPAPATCEIALTDPRSDIGQLRIRFPHPTTDEHVSYWAAPTFLRYHPASPHAGGSEQDMYRRPILRLTTDDEIGPSDDDGWRHRRDTVVGFGDDDTATLAMAEFFLDAAVFPYPRGEYQLEGPTLGGNALHPMSAHVRIALPHSELWSLLDF